MKNYEILNLVSLGVPFITANDLGAEDAYKVLKLKKAIKAAHSAIKASEMACVEEAGIKDPVTFDKKREELSKKEELSKEERKYLDTLNATFTRFMQLREKLYNDDAVIGELKPMSYESWHTLQKENKAVEINGKTMNVLNSYVEEVLEGILWEAPEDE